MIVTLCTRSVVSPLPSAGRWKKEAEEAGYMTTSHNPALPTLNLQFFCGSWQWRVFVCARSTRWTVGEKETHLNPWEVVWRRCNVARATLPSRILKKKLEKSSLRGRCRMLTRVCERARVLSWAWGGCLTKAARFSCSSHPAGRKKQQALRFKTVK